jgi:hypothetical protein
LTFKRGNRSVSPLDVFMRCEEGTDVLTFAFNSSGFSLGRVLVCGISSIVRYDYVCFFGCVSLGGLWD